MFNLNNRGQSLVLFVIFLPIVLLILMLVIDVIGLRVLKQELDNINQIVLDYGLDELSKIENENMDRESIEKKIVDLVKLNKEDIDTISVIIENDKIYIDLVDNEKGLLIGKTKKTLFNVKSSYVGYFALGEKRIENCG